MNAKFDVEKRTYVCQHTMDGRSNRWGKDCDAKATTVVLEVMPKEWIDKDFKRPNSLIASDGCGISIYQTLCSRHESDGYGNSGNTKPLDISLVDLSYIEDKDERNERNTEAALLAYEQWLLKQKFEADRQRREYIKSLEQDAAREFAVTRSTVTNKQGEVTQVTYTITPVVPEDDWRYGRLAGEVRVDEEEGIRRWNHSTGGYLYGQNNKQYARVLADILREVTANWDNPMGEEWDR